MRRWLPIAILGLAVAAMTTAPAAIAQVPTEDSVVAHGVQPGTVQADIDARSGHAGQNPTGRVNFHIGGGSGPTYSANATCLAVTGNTAVIGFLGTRFFSGFTVQVAGLIRLTDAGGPGSRLDVFEGPGAEDVMPPVSAPSDCSSFPTGAGNRFNVFEFAPDDIVVTDARPAGRMVGKGSLLVNGPPAPASYAYILSCNAAANTNAPFEIRLSAQRFRLTSTSSVRCTDDPAVPTPAAGFDTMTGTGTGMLTTGGPGTVQFTFVDGGAGGANDSVSITITDASGFRLFGGTAAPPGKFPGSDQATGNNTAQRR